MRCRVRFVDVGATARSSPVLLRKGCRRWKPLAALGGLWCLCRCSIVPQRLQRPRQVHVHAVHIVRRWRRCVWGCSTGRIRANRPHTRSGGLHVSGVRVFVNVLVYVYVYVCTSVCLCICVFVCVFPENAPGQRSVLPTARTSPVARTPTGTWTGCSAACAIPGSSQATAVKVRAGPAGVMTTATARAGCLSRLVQLVVLSVLCGRGCGRTCMCARVSGTINCACVSVSVSLVVCLFCDCLSAPLYVARRSRLSNG